ncbi:methionine aminopeptidase : Methionine aminopeptidase OS=Singulisphaera acidiphila (strain ATCC BAA-1392 / DSM 18658 / VKM B-2454 / MOB10) GN=map PE=3 SV=1: Peptidase_M24 [Gemmataceae bacterium]|nr:methionine aminopeptidase : Methionine aminopeptidase OS=Singulisphaera acidiphila (strain ATCC BAA-1392 / DSM 18658 / VKM B-2454 / MOB10) GN=map PE=3 SV=1: Peptidase_M24 [Gemmataceae bacterium]VTT97559.1 methionine aminopeptidase : Methionine aminopeptidase OS=Singulisphaera acidiphila (strain ATCC BAA-1392 / DSM 18658 / VKM B-2454 / MOB10) GN=map PE=3 SV=1: Peptidase_M24 [Gemmataceae bacterium]
MLRANNNRPPELKSARELLMMREAGKLVARALRICREMAKPGVKTIEIDQAVEAFYTKHNAVPLFKGYPGKTPFPAVTCLSVNEQVVHGVPGQRVLKEGDLLKVDTACRLDGWCADRAITLPIGTVSPEKARLLRVGQETLQIAIDLLPKRRWWSEVASAMQRHVEAAGFSVVTAYVGHGIGRTMHENPQVPNYVDRETRKSDFRLEPGLTLAIEPMVNMRRAEVDTLGDNWTVVTRDRMPSVHVEHTLALTAQGVQIITADEGAFDDEPSEPKA